MKAMEKIFSKHSTHLLKESVKIKGKLALPRAFFQTAVLKNSEESLLKSC
ncbi:MAG: hypothetical protein JSR80_04885 [Verrucomicrobia bacterium]|nr:hypothetical protein [Verrucomicrobiota bacterium]